MTIFSRPTLRRPAILAGIKVSRVFIDVDGSHRAALLDMSVQAGPRSAAMGGTLPRGANQPIEAKVTVKGMAGSLVDLIVDGDRAPLPVGDALGSDDETLHIPLAAARPRRWLRVDICDKSGKRLLIGNPVYIE